MDTEHFDVLVFGGGVAGVSAAIAAAEEGARTCLVERLGWLGGMVTGAYVIALCGQWAGKMSKHRTVAGNFDKIAERAIAEGAAAWTFWNRLISKKAGPGEWDNRRELTVDPEAFKYVLDRLVVDAGVYLKLHTNAEMTGRIDAGIMIDCTGDGVFGGTRSYPTRAGVTMGVRLGGVDARRVREWDGRKTPLPSWSDGEHSFTASGWMSLANDRAELFYDCMALGGCAGLDSVSKTRAEIDGRMVAHETVKYLRTQPGYKNCYLISTGPVLGNRKGRAVLTRYYLTDEDQDECMEDSIAVAGNVMRDYGYMEIPYRALLPKHTKNLLYAGRVFTPQVHGERENFIAYEIPRLVAPCIASGEAAGVAAAICADKRIEPADLDVAALQKRLVARGAVIHGVKE